VTFGVIITAIIGALYPAWKATKLNPVDAIHTI
jgi:ABC-type antimicrobial peptide transport system permease subunit